MYILVYFNLKYEHILKTLHFYVSLLVFYIFDVIVYIFMWTSQALAQRCDMILQYPHSSLLDFLRTLH